MTWSRKFKDITGQRFGRLEVLYRDTNDGEGRVVWMCRCDCGVQKRVTSSHLKKGNTLSCGCWRRERLGELAREVWRMRREAMT